MKKLIWFLTFMLCCNVHVIAKILPQSNTIIIKDLKKAGDVYLGNFDEKIRGDREIVMVAVKEHGTALKYATNALQNDKQIVLEAVKNDGLALQYADKSLRNDREVVLVAVKNATRALKYVDSSLKKDKEIVLMAVKYHPYAINYADKILQKDKVFLAQIEEQNNQRLQEINKPQKPYIGKIYKAKKRTCWQYDTSSLVAWSSWVAPGKKHLAKDEIKPIKEVYIWIKKKTKKEKYIALVAKVAAKTYRHNFIMCDKKKNQFACGGECDSGQLQLRKGMQLHLETLDFVIEDMQGSRAELVLTQREKDMWLKPKKTTCPKYVIEGLNVCYDKKVIDSEVSYKGCIRSHLLCDKIEKRHFGTYPDEDAAEAAYYRCEQSRPNK